MTDDTLTPDEVAKATGKKSPKAQAAALARLGIAFAFTGTRVRVQRAVAMAFELMPQEQRRGVDLSKVR